MRGRILHLRRFKRYSTSGLEIASDIQLERNAGRSFHFPVDQAFLPDSLLTNKNVCPTCDRRNLPLTDSLVMTAILSLRVSRRPTK